MGKKASARYIANRYNRSYMPAWVYWTAIIVLLAVLASVLIWYMGKMSADASRSIEDINRTLGISPYPGPPFAYVQRPPEIAQLCPPFLNPTEAQVRIYADAWIRTWHSYYLGHEICWPGYIYNVRENRPFDDFPAEGDFYVCLVNCGASQRVGGWDVEFPTVQAEALHASVGQHVLVHGTLDDFGWHSYGSRYIPSFGEDMHFELTNAWIEYLP